MSMLLALIAFLVTVLLHAHLRQRSGSMAIALQFLGCALPTWIIFAVVAFFLVGPSDALVSAILVYAVLCEAYVFLFTLAANGVSVSLMLRLSGGPRRPDEMRRDYDTRAMVERRLDQMLSAGLLEENAGLVAVGGPGARILGYYRAARRIFGHRGT